MPEITFDTRTCVSSCSDPYEQVVLPVDGLKEEEPVEPYQKIGPSKTFFRLCFKWRYNGAQNYFIISYAKTEQYLK